MYILNTNRTINTSYPILLIKSSKTTQYTFISVSILVNPEYSLYIICFTA